MSLFWLSCQASVLGFDISAIQRFGIRMPLKMRTCCQSLGPMLRGGVILQLEHKITALACKGDFTFAASKTEIVACQRMHR